MGGLFLALVWERSDLEEEFWALCCRRFRAKDKVDGELETLE